MMEFSGQKDETIHSVSGFTLIEMILTIGVLSILGGLGVYSYANSYRVNLLNNTAEEIVSLARFAQQESMSQKNANASGVRFDNINSSSPFVAVFSGSYAPANIKEYYQLLTKLNLLFHLRLLKKQNFKKKLTNLINIFGLKTQLANLY